MYYYINIYLALQKKINSCYFYYILSYGVLYITILDFINTKKIYI